MAAGADGGGQWSRTEALIGHAGVERLRAARVAVFGLGGVGSFAAEALARAGVGALDLIDADAVEPSNINRQLAAAHSTLGLAKADVMRARVLDINPACAAVAHRVFFDAASAALFDFGAWSYVVDAIDGVPSKLLLAEMAAAADTPIISCMGAGNKLDPTRFEVADIGGTQVCPLARAMRRSLAKRGAGALKVVYSKEPPLTPLGADGLRAPYAGSVPFVPSAAGLIIAGEVVKDLASGAKTREG